MQCLTFNSWNTGSTAGSFTASGTVRDADPCTSSESVVLPYNTYQMLTGTVDLTKLGINAADIDAVATWGFLVILLGFVFGYAISIMVGIIKDF